MNLTIERGPALSALARAVGVVERKQTVPVLGNVLLHADGDVLTIRATDLDMEAVETMPALISEAGEITIPADKLHDIVRSASDGAQIALSMGGEDPRVRVQSGRSRFNLPALSPKDFPTFSDHAFEGEFAMPAKTLADMLARAGWSRAPGNGDSNLQCVYLVTTDAALNVVGCQSSGVAVRREPRPEGAELSHLLVPKTVAQLTRWLADAEGDVTVDHSQGLIRFRQGGGTLVSKFFSGAYVPYDRILLETHGLSAKTDQDVLTAAVKRVLIVADVKNLSVRLTFSSGVLTIQARNDQSGEGKDEIGCEYEGPEVSFLVTASQLLESLAALRGDIVEICFCEKEDPKVNSTRQVVVKAPCDEGLVVNIMQPRA